MIRATSILVLKRSLFVSKHEWRQDACHRTLIPIDVEHLLKSTWQGSQSQLPEQGSLELSLRTDGSPENAPSIHSIQGQQKAFIGVFDFSFMEGGKVKVMLREEQCSRQLGTPRRRTRQIALLRPWKPVRVLLNGRYASNSGQHYILQEYHFALCNEPAPARLETTRFVDLQADIM
jgi:hypothetical protein